MIDIPIEPPAYQMIVTSKGTTAITLTLPQRDDVLPIVVIPTDKQSVRVLDPDGKALATLSPGDKATFEFRKPKWWEFWKSEGWATAPAAHPTSSAPARE